MESTKARKIIKINKLINKKKSREIINFIKDKRKKLTFKLTKDDLRKIEKIRNEYDLIKKKNKNQYSSKSFIL